MGISVNRVILIGQLKCSPNLLTLKGGRDMCTLEIVTTEECLDGTGDLQITHTPHRVKFFGERAADLALSLKAGECVYVEGRINSKPWPSSRGRGRGHLLYQIHGEKLETLGPKTRRQVFEPVTEEELSKEISLQEIKKLLS